MNTAPSTGAASSNLTPGSANISVRLIVVSSLLARMALWAVPGAFAKKPFNGNICAIPSAAALAGAHISDSCPKSKMITHPLKPSPLGGTTGSTVYTAHWGKLVGVTGPSHYLGDTGHQAQRIRQGPLHRTQTAL